MEYVLKGQDKPVVCSSQTVVITIVRHQYAAATLLRLAPSLAHKLSAPLGSWEELIVSYQTGGKLDFRAQGQKYGRLKKYRSSLTELLQTQIEGDGVGFKAELSMRDKAMSWFSTQPRVELSGAMKVESSEWKNWSVWKMFCTSFLRISLILPQYCTTCSAAGAAKKCWELLERLLESLFESFPESLFKDLLESFFYNLLKSFFDSRHNIVF